MMTQPTIPRRCLPHGKSCPIRPLTLLDYRKLLIDLPGVKNAWLTPAPLTYYADTRQGQLLATDTGQPGVMPVNVRGLYAIRVEYNDTVTTPAAQATVLSAVQQRLQANRNLCEDFVSVTEVETQSFRLCAELEVTPTADVARINAEIWFQVQQYLAPTRGQLFPQRNAGAHPGRWHALPCGRHL